VAINTDNSQTLKTSRVGFIPARCNKCTLVAVI